MKYLELPENLYAQQPFILFDGECNLCNKSVGFLIRHNTSGNLNFASMQSKTGQLVLKLAGISASEKETLYFIDTNYIFSHSTAALKITAHLQFPWNLLRMFTSLPVHFRDYVYSLIAANRNRWFGRVPECSISEDELRQRFIN
jgi:predicted DCC family thiol-disulfide oxidoreductase YuxK